MLSRPGVLPITLALLLGAWPAPPAAVAAERLCYQQLSGPADRRDVEQLWIEPRGSRLVGSYRWIPWGKDRRIGQLSGRLLRQGTALLTYAYVQEGQRGSDTLALRFDDRQARIIWQSTPLNQKPLPRHPCDRLQPVALP